jgi:hypothetical protein
MRRSLPVLLLLSCGPSTATDPTSATQPARVSPPVTPPSAASQLQPGPVRRALTPTQRARIEAVHTVLAEVDGGPLEQWIEDFSRDQNPDRELEIFEAIAAAFTGFVADKQFDLAQRKEAYSLLLARSTSPVEVVLAELAPQHLTPEQRRALLAGYRLEPRPITVAPAP